MSDEYFDIDGAAKDVSKVETLKIERKLNHKIFVLILLISLGGIVSWTYIYKHNLDSQDSMAKYFLHQDDIKKAQERWTECVKIAIAFNQGSQTCGQMPQ